MIYGNEIEEQDVPPLEDMSEAINQLKLQKRNPTCEAKISQYLEPSKDESSAKSESILKILGKENEVQDNQSKAMTKMQTVSRATTKPESYCGFKKGFLLGNSAKTNTKQATSKPKVGEQQFDVVKDNTQHEKNIIPEVQDALKTQLPLLKSKDWVTDDLLTKIMAHPKLSKQFLDPLFSEAIAKFQTNPKEVMAMCETNSELREFIQDFCAMMGDHFTNIAEKQDKIKESTEKPSSGNIYSTTTYNNNNSNTSRGMSEQDEEQMKKILSNPQVSSILKSHEVQNLLYLLKTDPAKGQRFVSNAEPSLRRKIQTLIDAGLLQFSSG